MIIALEGPEKAGKTTLASALKEEFKKSNLDFSIWKWGPPPKNYRTVDDIDLIQQVEESGQHEIWDRAWVGRHVYSRMNADLDTRYTMVHPAIDDFTCEWKMGMRVMDKIMLIPHLRRVLEHRDETDIICSPIEESQRFLAHGTMYGWDIYLEDWDVDLLVSDIVISTVQRMQYPHIHGDWSNRGVITYEGVFPGLCHPTIKMMGATACRFLWADVSKGEVPPSLGSVYPFKDIDQDVFYSMIR